MILRSLVTLGLGAVIALSSPAIVSAQATAPTVEKSEKVASVETEKPKAKAKAKPSKASQKKKQLAKNKKAKADKEAEQATKENSGGLFAALFGGPVKDESATDKPVAKKTGAKAAKEAAAKGKATLDRAAKAKKEEPVIEVPKLEIVSTGNNGELRSEVKPENKDLFSALFGGGQPALLAETRALDAALAAKDQKKKFKVKSDFEPQQVEFSGYKSGTIVIDTGARYLYLVESSGSARRYAIAVGRDGLQFKGSVTVGDKQEWPRWIPTKEMQAREPKKYGQYKDGMPGGPENPLGARAIYLYQGKKDTHLRIHGTNQPQSIGTSASNGCFRMINDHVKDLYGRVKMGTQVVVL